MVGVVALVLLLGGTIFAATFVGNRQTIETLSASLIRRATDQTEVRLRQFFEPVVQQLRIATAQRGRGLLDTDDPKQINDVLVPLLQNQPQMSSLMVADSRGREHMILHIGETWRVRQTRVDEWDKTVRWIEWTDVAPEPTTREEELGYEPRERPWFEGAVARRDGSLHWTPPYTFFTTKDPGITASVCLPGEDGAPDRVIGFDILLNDISRFTTGPELKVSENGLVFVTERESAEVLGLPRVDPFLTEKGRRAAVRKQVDALEVPVMRDALAAWTEVADTDRGEPFQFRSGGQAWWGGVRDFPLSADRALRIGVVLPESDLTGGLGQLRLIILGVVLAVLVGALIAAVRLADGVSDPIEELVEGSERIAQGDLEPGAPIESDLREVKTLADAQERLRVGLKTLIKVERDLQVARQIQQNTFPDLLPGLDGFDLEGWAEPADETGGDTYDVIGLNGEWSSASIVAEGESADRAVLMLADATGHGIGPALSAMQLRAMLRMAMRVGGDLEGIAAHINQQLVEDLPAARFLTTWLGMLDPDAATLRTFSAGQAPLLHYHAERDEVEVLKADAPPFGIMPIKIDIGEPFALEPGDLYVVLSDGIYEAQDPDDEKFGTERVVEVVRAHRHHPPKQILMELRRAVEAFSKGRPADDDRTAVIIKRL